MNPDDPLDPELEDRLRAHFADRTAREPLPGDGAVPPALPATRSWWQRPPILAAAAAVLAVALVGAFALRDDDPQELQVIDSTTTTTEDGSTTTTETTVPDTTTTTVPATTTTTVPPGSDVQSVIVSVDGILGWWDGTRFVSWDEGSPPPLSGGEQYAVVGLDGADIATGSAPRPGCDVLNPGVVSVDVPGLERAAVLDPSPVAVTGVADPTPRPVAAIGAAPYVEAVVEALAEAGIADAAPQLAQVLRTDLEGDGTDEVLIVAERLSSPENLFAEPGDYSVLLLRQVVDGVVVTSQLGVSRAAESGDPFIVAFRVGAVADLNGDGTMEVVTRQRYYEGASTSVVAVDPDGGASTLMEVGCGA